MKTYKKIHKSLLQLLTFGLINLWSIQAFANKKTTGLGIGLDTDLRPTTLPSQTLTSTKPQDAIIQTVGNIIDFIILISGSLSVFFIVYAGLQYVLARGQDDGISQAKNNITWVVIGLITMFFSMVIVRFVISVTLGLEEVN